MNTKHRLNTFQSSAALSLLLATSPGCCDRLLGQDNEPNTPNLFLQQTAVREQKDKAGRKGVEVELQRTPAPGEMHRVVTGFGGRNSRVLVVPPVDADSDKLARLYEDLAVMSKIFDKALDKSANRGHGTRLYFGGQDQPGDFDALYLDGYGAVFLLSVDFPIIEPAKAEKPKKEAAEDQDKTWEQTRREVQSGRRGGFDALLDDPEDQEDAPEFDGSRVAELKSHVIGALKHASNLSAVKGDESVTVIVFGHGGFGPWKGDNVVKAVRGNYPAARFNMVPAPGERRRQQIILRVPKSDVDAFAKGRLTADEFTRKVVITTN